MKTATYTTENTKEDMNKAASLYLRVPLKVRQTIKEIARDEGLTMNAVCINLMTEALRSRARKMGR